MLYYPMGGSSSKARVTQKEDINVFNEDNMKIVSKQLNSFITENLVKNAQSCSNLQLQDAEINLANCEFGEDATVNLSVTQKAVMELSCISDQQVVQKTQNELISHVMKMLENKVDNKTLSKMNATAKTASESGAIKLPWGGADSSTDVNQERSHSYTSKTNKYIEDVVANKVLNSFTTESVQDCIANQIQKAAIKLNRCKFGDRASVNAEIDQASKAVLNCVQKQNYGGTVVQGVLNTLKLKDTTIRTTTVETETGAEAEAEAKSKGALQTLGEALRNTLAGVGDALGGIFGGLLGGGPISIVSVVLCVLVIIAVAAYFLLSGGGSDEYSEDDMDEDKFQQEGTEDMGGELYNTNSVHQ